MVRALWRKNRVALFFLWPWFVGLVGLGIVPMLFSLYFSFTDYNMYQMPRWIGVRNFVEMVHDPRFVQALKVTTKYVVFGVPLQLITAFSLALLLNKGMPGLPLFRAIFYIPSLLGPSVAIAILWREVFGLEGIFNRVASLFGIPERSWIADPSTALYTLVVLLVWQFGSPMIIFLAGLRQVPAELYESAAIDGAGVVARFLHITLPGVSSVIFFNLVMQVIHAFQAFTSAYIVGGGQGGVVDSTLFYTLYLYIKGFNEFQMGYASSLAWVLLIIIAFLTYLLFLSSRKWVYYES